MKDLNSYLVERDLFETRAGICYDDALKAFLKAGTESAQENKYRRANWGIELIAESYLLDNRFQVVRDSRTALVHTVQFPRTPPVFASMPPRRRPNPRPKASLFDVPRAKAEIPTSKS